MKILIDINHPAHVHYFKHFIKIMENKKHQVGVISRNKEIEHLLLNKYNIPFKSRGTGSNSVLGKTLYFFKAIILILGYAIKFKPDIVLSFGTPYPAIVSFLLRKPHISFTDTEHAKLHHLLTDHFSKYIITPESYRLDHSPKQIRFKTSYEMAYLHPDYYQPDERIYEILGVEKGKPYIILRFVSWNAIHDVGESGLTYERKKRIVSALKGYAKVFISSEGELPEDLKQYQIQIPPDKIHDALAYASLYIGEGGTTATECTCLGTPSILINSLLHPDTIPGVHIELRNMGLQFLYEQYDEAIIPLAIDLLTNEVVQKKFIGQYKKYMKRKVDVTRFLVNKLQNYPESIQ